MGSALGEIPLRDRRVVEMDKSIAAVGAAVIVALVAGFVVLSWAGRDTAGYTLFVTGPLVSGAVGVILSKRVAVVQHVAEVVQHQTNSLLTTRLDSLDNQLNAAAGDRADNAQAAAHLPDPGV